MESEGWGEASSLNFMLYMYTWGPKKGTSMSFSHVDEAFLRPGSPWPEPDGVFRCVTENMHRGLPIC